MLILLAEKNMDEFWVAEEAARPARFVDELFGSQGWQEVSPPSDDLSGHDLDVHKDSMDDAEDDAITTAVSSMDIQRVVALSLEACEPSNAEASSEIELPLPWPELKLNAVPKRVADRGRRGGVVALSIKASDPLEKLKASRIVKLEISLKSTPLPEVNWAAGTRIDRVRKTTKIKEVTCLPSILKPTAELDNLSKEIQGSLVNPAPQLLARTKLQKKKNNNNKTKKNKKQTTLASNGKDRTRLFFNQQER